MAAYARLNARLREMLLGGRNGGGFGADDGDNDNVDDVGEGEELGAPLRRFGRRIAEHVRPRLGGDGDTNVRENLGAAEAPGESAALFQHEFCTVDAISRGEECHALAGTGQRIWGSYKTGTRFLKIKLYDFGLFVDEKKTVAHVANRVTNSAGNTSRMRRRRRRRRAGLLLRSLGGLVTRPASLVFRRSNRSHPNRRARRRSEQREGDRADGTNEAKLESFDIEDVLCHVNNDATPMTVVYKFARDLPVERVVEEYDGVLRRRMGRLGATRTDNLAIDLLLGAVSDVGGECDRGTSWINETGDFRKGTEMAFSRKEGGQFTVEVNRKRVISIKSAKLCDAFFDVYLGRAQPLSAKARRQVGEFIREKVATARTGSTGEL